MTATRLRKKVHQYVDDVEENILEVVYNMLKIYVDEDDASLMSKSQKAEIDKRTRLFHQGKIKTSSWEDVKKRSRAEKK